MNSVEERAHAWRRSSDTGASSKTIWDVMMGKEPRRPSDYPRDGADLGRCLRLLEAIPEWKTRLGEMSAVSNYWAALVDNWADLERLSKLTAPSPLQNRMKAILAPIEAADPHVFRLGPNMTMRIGR